MKVVGIQFNIAWEDPVANLLWVRGLASQARDRGAELLVLPEMFGTGFSMAAESVARHASQINDVIQNLAQETGLAILAGFAEEESGSFFNSCSFYDPSGKELLRYRKIHPFSLAQEDKFYKPGDRIETVEWGGLRITPFICYDLRFPEIFRSAVQETDLFCVLANWPAKRSFAWRSLLTARAIENQAYVLGVNRIGTASGQVYNGHSVLLDPMGEVLSHAVDRQALIEGEVSADLVRDIRERFSFVADRRVDLY